jgi:hypothetical protein
MLNPKFSRAFALLMTFAIFLQSFFSSIAFAVTPATIDPPVSPDTGDYVGPTFSNVNVQGGIYSDEGGDLKIINPDTSAENLEVSGDLKVAGTATLTILEIVGGLFADENGLKVDEIFVLTQDGKITLKDDVLVEKDLYIEGAIKGAPGEDDAVVIDDDLDVRGGIRTNSSDVNPDWPEIEYRDNSDTPVVVNDDLSVWGNFVSNVVDARLFISNQRDSWPFVYESDDDYFNLPDQARVNLELPGDYIYGDVVIDDNLAIQEKLKVLGDFYMLGLEDKGTNFVLNGDINLEGNLQNKGGIELTNRTNFEVGDMEYGDNYYFEEEQPNPYSHYFPEYGQNGDLAPNLPVNIKDNLTVTGPTLFSASQELVPAKDWYVNKIGADYCRTKCSRDCDSLDNYAACVSECGEYDAMMASLDVCRGLCSPDYETFMNTCFNDPNSIYWACADKAVEKVCVEDYIRGNCDPYLELLEISCEGEEDLKNCLKAGINSYVSCVSNGRGGSVWSGQAEDGAFAACGVDASDDCMQCKLDESEVRAEKAICAILYDDQERYDDCIDQEVSSANCDISCADNEPDYCPGGLFIGDFDIAVPSTGSGLQFADWGLQEVSTCVNSCVANGGDEQECECQCMNPVECTIHNTLCSSGALDKPECTCECVLYEEEKVKVNGEEPSGFFRYIQNLFTAVFKTKTAYALDLPDPKAGGLTCVNVCDYTVGWPHAYKDCCLNINESCSWDGASSCEGGALEPCVDFKIEALCNAFDGACAWDGSACYVAATPATPDNCRDIPDEISCDNFPSDCQWSAKGLCLNFGCLDPAADNYDLIADLPDDSCTYGNPLDIYGCTEEWATNYNPAATINDSSCIIAQIPGCTDSTATNYDSAATIDDDTCLYGPADPPTGSLCFYYSEPCTFAEEGDEEGGVINWFKDKLGFGGDSFDINVCREGSVEVSNCGGLTEEACVNSYWNDGVNLHNCGWDSDAPDSNPEGDGVSGGGVLEFFGGISDSITGLFGGDDEGEPVDNGDSVPVFDQILGLVNIGGNNDGNLGAGPIDQFLGFFGGTPSTMNDDGDGAAPGGITTLLSNVGTMIGGSLGVQDSLTIDLCCSTCKDTYEQDLEFCEDDDICIMNAEAAHDKCGTICPNECSTVTNIVGEIVPIVVSDPCASCKMDYYSQNFDAAQCLDACSDTDEGCKYSCRIDSEMTRLGAISYCSSAGGSNVCKQSCEQECDTSETITCLADFGEEVESCMPVCTINNIDTFDQQFDECRYDRTESCLADTGCGGTAPTDPEESCCEGCDSPFYRLAPLDRAKCIDNCGEHGEVCLETFDVTAEDIEFFDGGNMNSWLGFDRNEIAVVGDSKLFINEDTGNSVVIGGIPKSVSLVGPAIDPSNPVKIESANSSTATMTATWLSMLKSSLRDFGLEDLWRTQKGYSIETEGDQAANLYVAGGIYSLLGANAVDFSLADISLFDWSLLGGNGGGSCGTPCVLSTTVTDISLLDLTGIDLSFLAFEVLSGALMDISLLDSSLYSASFLGYDYNSLANREWIVPFPGSGDGPLNPLNAPMMIGGSNSGTPMLDYMMMTPTDYTGLLIDTDTIETYATSADPVNGPPPLHINRHSGNDVNIGGPNQMLEPTLEVYGHVQARSIGDYSVEVQRSLETNEQIIKTATLSPLSSYTVCPFGYEMLSCFANATEGLETGTTTQERNCWLGDINNNLTVDPGENWTLGANGQCDCVNFQCWETCIVTAKDSSGANNKQFQSVAKCFNPNAENNIFNDEYPAPLYTIFYN